MYIAHMHGSVKIFLHFLGNRKKPNNIHYSTTFNLRKPASFLYYLYYIQYTDWNPLNLRGAGVLGVSSMIYYTCTEYARNYYVFCLSISVALSYGISVSQWYGPTVLRVLSYTIYYKLLILLTINYANAGPYWGRGKVSQSLSLSVLCGSVSR